ncbi:ABC transporter permease subunit [Amaricoccus sp.]|uniref:amino acid ABC transporter permease n=1 Tax=Amaricoccus sp. TaxID=1872485 RepID=UPI001B7ADBDB|nr:ABC transporter permease subunit [Amaricoccus sp.]MBP7000215.1 ABC transporter permease subunit [Amaricoccus sp.]
MASIDYGERPFRLGMLLSDTRYRSMTIQVVAVMAFMLVIAWLVNNTIQNLSALGKTFDFGFLSSRAGYDINQALIPYTNDSTHGRAAVVGILNTILVAVLGCILATAIGVLIGVLRLSNNWIVSRLAGAYVDIFRNVPVLLWILALMAVITDLTPAPAAFRGENAAAQMLFNDSVAVTNRGLFIPWPVFGPGWQVVVGAFVLSLVAIVVFGRWAAARQEATGQALPTPWIKLGLLILPTLLVDMAMGGPISLDYPVLQRFNFQGGGFVDKALVALTLALSLYTGAFIAENVRAGIQAVSRGQSEAAAALGLRPNRIMSLVVLPQALRVIIPPLISQYLNLTKNSSLAIAVGYMDVRATLGGITMNQTGRELECMLLLMGFYLLVSLTVSSAMNWYNARVSLKER